jgi:hypothetical protein
VKNLKQITAENVEIWVYHAPPVSAPKIKALVAIVFPEIHPLDRIAGVATGGGIRQRR